MAVDGEDDVQRAAASVSDPTPPDAVPEEASAADVVMPPEESSDETSNAVEDAAPETAPDESRGIEQAQIDGLTAAVDRLSDRLRADQDVIARMQNRIESLQGDQVRALLGPAVTELANLHAAFAESAGRDYERLGFDRVRKEFTLLGDRLESAIDLLGAVSVDARAADAFDSRAHQAVKQIPTGDPALDKTIATVVRQGFRFDPEGKPALYARVQVYSYDPLLAASAVSSSPETEPRVDGDTPLPPTIEQPPADIDVLDDLDLPLPLDPR